MNVNTLDEVPDSSWFTNRIGRREIPIAGARARAGSRDARDLARRLDRLGRQGHAACSPASA